jgi:hypothetical protein
MRGIKVYQNPFYTYNRFHWKRLDTILKNAALGPFCMAFTETSS